MTIQPSSTLCEAATVTIIGLTGSQTADDATLTVTDSGVFGGTGVWTQGSGTLLLTVPNGQTVPSGSTTTFSISLTNPAAEACSVNPTIQSDDAVLASAAMSGYVLGAGGAGTTNPHLST